MITIDELKTFLWGAATLLRGQIDASGYKEYIFPLLFFKRISDVYDEQYNSYLEEADGDKEYADSQVYDIVIPDGAHWADVRNVSENVGQKLVEAFNRIERANAPKEVDGRFVGGLTGIFGDKSGWTNKNLLPDYIIKSLIEHFSKYDLSMSSCPADEMGTAYEYLVGQFANDAGHTAQEFYTNRTVVTLMAEILQPKPHESIYDPTCGSGGMLIKSLTYLKDKGEDYQDVKVYGQEVNVLTSAIARMNLYLHSINEFSVACADTLTSPAFTQGDKIQKFDVVLANPPYSIKIWNREMFSSDKWGRNFLGTPPQGRADYAFMQHILASMDDESGRSAMLLPHGVLNRMEEDEMRINLVGLDWIDCVISIGKNLFFNSPMEACIIICRTKKPAERKGKVQFIRATDWVERVNGESYLTDEHIKEISNLYFNYKDIEGRCSIKTIDEIKSNRSSLSPKLYVKVAGQSSSLANIEELIKDWSSISEGLTTELNELTDMV